MAGSGSRFSEKGWDTPKPLIPVKGNPMVIWALESVNRLDISEYIFIVLKEHEIDYKVSALLSNKIRQRTNFIFLDEVTEGQLCTVLAAEEDIDMEEDVLIMASDSLVISPDLKNDIRQARVKGWSGLISTINLPGDRWSFARTDDLGKVVEVAEKVRISNYASTGIYYFALGKELVKYGKAMIEKKEKTRGEYYVIPVYQKMIDAGKHIGISKASEMWDMGTPVAKEVFEKNIHSIRKTLSGN